MPNLHWQGAHLSWQFRHRKGPPLPGLYHGCRAGVQGSPDDPAAPVPPLPPDGDQLDQSLRPFQPPLAASAGPDPAADWDQLWLSHPAFPQL